MKITNKENLPDPLVRAIQFDDYDREGCDYTVTELITPPRIAALTKRHWDEIEEDASDRLWLLLGSAGHEVLRRASKGGIVERRFITYISQRKVGGKIDYYAEDGSLDDYKFVSAWAVKDGHKPEWEQQLNCYLAIATLEGVAVKTLRIISILRDWTVTEAARSKDYPQSQVRVLNIPKWPAGRAVLWMAERIALHEAARNGALPECTPEETWERPAKWAVMKVGRERAIKLHDSEIAANDHAEEEQRLSGKKVRTFYVEHRPGSRPRCEHYCAVAPFCEQWAKWKEINQRKESNI